MKKSFIIPSIKITECSTENILTASAPTNATIATEGLESKGANYITTVNWDDIKEVVNFTF